MRVRLTNSTLERDALLAQDIDLSTDIILDIPDTSQHILLTGATGFLGVFLLRSLLERTSAKIYCLVRSKENKSGEERLKELLKQYQLQKQVDYSRFIAVEGDLEQPSLGMSEEDYETLSGLIDTIYHNGALVNYVYPYAALKKANVTATEDILRFAVKKRLKPVHYVSTMFVFSGKDYVGEPVIKEDYPPVNGAEVNMGYGQSKWVAEKMMHLASEKGIPATILRIGRISGDTLNGFCQTKDFLWGIIRTCFHVGCRPELDIHINISPVDFVSDAIVSIASDKEAWGKAFHILNPESVTFDNMFDMLSELGYNLEKLPFEEWKTRVLRFSENSADTSHELLIRTLEQLDLNNTNRVYDMSHSLTFLKKTSVSCPAIDKELLAKYLKYFMDIGFIKP